MDLNSIKQTTQQTTRELLEKCYIFKRNGVKFCK